MCEQNIQEKIKSQALARCYQRGYVYFVRKGERVTVEP